VKKETEKEKEKRNKKRNKKRKVENGIECSLERLPQANHNYLIVLLKTKALLLNSKKRMK